MDGKLCQNIKSPTPTHIPWDFAKTGVWKRGKQALIEAGFSKQHWEWKGGGNRKFAWESLDYSMLLSC